MSDNESDDDDHNLRAPLPAVEGDQEELQPFQAPNGLFSLPDSTQIILPAQLGVGDKRSAAALANTVVIFDAIQQLVRELGPAFKKLRPNNREPGMASSSVTAREYKSKFLDAEQLWFARLIMEPKTTKDLWAATLNVKEKNSIVVAFMLQNNIVGAGVETVFRQTLNKFATNKKHVLKHAMCASILALTDIQRKVPFLLALLWSIFSFIWVFMSVSKDSWVFMCVSNAVRVSLTFLTYL